MKVFEKFPFLFRIRINKYFIKYIPRIREENVSFMQQTATCFI